MLSQLARAKTAATTPNRVHASRVAVRVVIATPSGRTRADSFPRCRLSEFVSRSVRVSAENLRSFSFRARVVLARPGPTHLPFVDERFPVPLVKDPSGSLTDRDARRIGSEKARPGVPLARTNPPRDRHEHNRGGDGPGAHPDPSEGIPRNGPPQHGQPLGRDRSPPPR